MTGRPVADGSLRPVGSNLYARDCAMTAKIVWLETTYHLIANRTEWRVVCEGTVIHTEILDRDITGAESYDRASGWITDHGFVLGGWTHAAENAPGETTEPRFCGWLHCTLGGREPVSITGEELADLDAGRLSCPVCGDSCRPKFAADTEAQRIAFSWSGSRWRQSS